MVTYGYARVSTFDQDLTIQQQALRAAGCGVVRAEKASGSRRDGPTELQVLLDFVQPGDTLVVTRIDRLARSLKDLQDIVHELRDRGVILRATEQPVDTGTAGGKAFFGMLGVFAEFETNLRPERQLDGDRAGQDPRRPSRPQAEHRQSGNPATARAGRPRPDRHRPPARHRPRQRLPRARGRVVTGNRRRAAPPETLAGLRHRPDTLPGHRRVGGVYTAVSSDLRKLDDLRFLPAAHLTYNKLVQY